MADALLEAIGVTVRFGGKTALSDTTVASSPAESPASSARTAREDHAVQRGVRLQGPNSGRVVLGGHDVTRLSPHKRARRGWPARSSASSCSRR